MRGKDDADEVSADCTDESSRSHAEYFNHRYEPSLAFGVTVVVVVVAEVVEACLIGLACLIEVVADRVVAAACRVAGFAAVGIVGWKVR